MATQTAAKTQAPTKPADRTSESALVVRTSYTEALTFPSKPDGQTLNALRKAGFRWNGTDWVRQGYHTETISDLTAFLAPTQQKSA